MKSLHLSLIVGALTAVTSPAQFSTSTDYWDVTQGAVITATSGTMIGAGSPAGLFGENGQNNADPATLTYFVDGQPFDFVHYVEWETPADVTIGEVRVFAYGDDFLNNGREFNTFTLKAKSPGSATYDITVVNYNATHPFSFVDPFNALVVDEVIAPLTARYFRAEFTQYDAGNGWDGPRILEIDGLPVPRPTVNIPPVSNDAWDVSQGVFVTGSSAIHPGAGTLTSLFGEFGQNNFDGSTFTYFSDAQPAGFAHYVEWETAANINLGGVRLYAFGDGNLNNGREFDQFTLKTKSPGSSTYDITLLTFTPAHPYELLDPNNFLLLDATIPAVSARYFRAEFVQYNAGFGWDGPRIVELDAILASTPPPSDPPPPTPVPPVIVTEPQSVTANYAMPVALTVQATVTGAAQYQWYKDGVALPGLTTAGIWIAALSATDVGVYHVTVTDEVGTTSSAAAAVTLDTVKIVPSAFDLWDSRVGAAVIAHSDLALGSPNGMFGAGSPVDGSDVTQFADSQSGVIEWTTPSAVQVNTVRLFARGGSGAGEFSRLTLKAKSPGSDTFDILIGSFTPDNPYTFLDEATSAILDTEIAPIVATAFRAEFSNLRAGPRILELDAFTTRPIVAPAVVVAPASQIAIKGKNAVFQVVARGGNLSYQWKFNGRPIDGATTDMLLISPVRQPDEGNYTVVISNELGSIETSPAMLNVTNKTRK